MLDARALAIGWISSALLLAAGLAYGMQTAAGIALDRGLVGAADSPSVHRVVPAGAPPAGFRETPAFLRGDAGARAARCDTRARNV